jgi:hypothetical protein
LAGQRDESNDSMARLEQWLAGRSPALLSEGEIEAAGRDLGLDPLDVCELGLMLAAASQE